LIYQFADCSLDIERQELRRGTELVDVEPQVLDILQYLIRNRERIVSKDDLIEHVWHGRIVSESTLTSRITAARQAIGDSGDQQRLIRTIARKGIRFVGEVRSDQSSPAGGSATSAMSFSLDAMEPRLPIKPSIAVLPFTNMSGDPEQEHFADGITEDLITSLSQIHWLFVIARNSTFVYKGRAVDVKQVSRELGVRYVLEGSVRRVGNRLRISAQLIDGTTSTHHWAERYDREFTGIFTLQDEITRSVAAAIEPRMLEVEGIRSLSRSPDDLDAWALVARALTYFWRSTRDDTKAAIGILEQATARYPDYALAHSLLSFSLTFAGHMGWTDQAEALKNSRRHLKVAVKLDNNDPWAHLALGCLAMLERRTAESIAAFRRAVELNPNSAFARALLGRGLAWAGRSDEAIAEVTLAIRLSPRDPQKPLFDMAIAMAHYLAGRFAEAATIATSACKLRPDIWGPRRMLCASLANAGRVDEARQELALLKNEHHDLSVEWVRQHVPFPTAELMERYLDGLRAAGLT